MRDVIQNAWHVDANDLENDQRNDVRCRVHQPLVAFWIAAGCRRTGGLTTSVIICAIALLAEAFLGYPEPLFLAVGHPVTWIGAAISWADRRFNRETDTPRSRRRWGALTMVSLVVFCGLIASAISAVLLTELPKAVAILLLAAIASTCLAQRGLHEHVRAVADAIDRESLKSAREAVGAIVGRDTSSLSEAGVARAAIESLAENFADGVVAPTLWLAFLGLPGALVYKAINTADSMIGHRTPRHEAFGFCAAKLDDIVNWPAARLAALCLVGAAVIDPESSMRDAWRIMRRDASGHASPNAGWPEAAMAGALGIRLGGPRVYAGRTVDDSYIGDGERRAGSDSIRRALRIYRIACALQFVIILVAALVIGRLR